MGSCVVFFVVYNGCELKIFRSVGFHAGVATAFYDPCHLIGILCDVIEKVVQIKCKTFFTGPTRKANLNVFPIVLDRDNIVVDVVGCEDLDVIHGRSNLSFANNTGVFIERIFSDENDVVEGCPKP